MSDTGKTDNRPTDWTGPAKWAVIGLVAVAFMAIFRDELKGMLGRADSVTVGSEGISVKLRTVSTPLGETVLSSSGAQITQATPRGERVETPPAQLAQYTDARYGFSLAWPQNGNWVRDDGVAQRFGAALVVRHLSAFGNFTPNVNVTTEPTGNVTVAQWMEAGNTSFAALGFQLVSSQSDPATQSGVRVTRHTGVQGVLYQIQRVILRDGMAFVVTASKLEQVGAPGLYEEMGQILNSFRVE